MRNTLIFLVAASGSGKAWFFEHYLADKNFYRLMSHTTRVMRLGETDGVEYHFKTGDEKFFEENNWANYLWVNKTQWEAEQKSGGEKIGKWLYGVLESEVFAHLRQNLVYDVNEPRYIRSFIDWFRKNNLNYSFKVVKLNASKEIMDNVRQQRANMPHDLEVRKKNTATMKDFKAAGVNINYRFNTREPEKYPRTLSWLNNLKCRVA